ncbi:uncharacterized protein ACA1_276070 [Acanthamoeba castellanii str. Neff]|uniref:Uncharacterized protein n=1 Tax=Acanthamoeba castellanii (strain ATCC 30010 / Neff) TaxID=1257118 RepID=L8GR39_ACACF|nr:uncharacterized protein ACA1_276070 [Acanthamoeba castellanii str. Neff]ELR15412.1 hypothetical protein ACA1_276070 [Acanthamoeba castellanii str. Neff]
MAAGMGKMLIMLTSCPPLALQLPVIFLMREINFEDPTNLFFVRVAFGSVAALSAMTLYYMYTRIQSKADGQRKIMVPPPATPSWGAAAELLANNAEPETPQEERRKKKKQQQLEAAAAAAAQAGAEGAGASSDKKSSGATKKRRPQPAKAD